MPAVAQRKAAQSRHPLACRTKRRLTVLRNVKRRKCPRCNTRHQRSHAYCLECNAAYARQWRKTHPLNEEQRRKDSARSYAGVWLRRGKLQRKPCQECGASKTEIHHPDYSKPTRVEWICRPCHLALHRKQLKQKVA